MSNSAATPPVGSKLTSNSATAHDAVVASAVESTPGGAQNPAQPRGAASGAEAGAPGTSRIGDPRRAGTEGSSPSPEEDLETVDLGDATILLVDDNLQNLELMQAYLEELPCRVLTAADGVEAVTVIDRQRPDVVLLDVMMPRMSGFEVCQKIKSMPATRDIVVIMVTALHETSDFERAVECGTDDFLTKPVNKLELLTRVRSLARVRLLKRRLDELMGVRRGRSSEDVIGEEAGRKLDADLSRSDTIGP